MTTRRDSELAKGAIYLAPLACGSLLPLLTLPIFTRFLTPEDYGVLALAQVYATFAVGLSHFGLPVGYERNFFQYNTDVQRAELFYSTLAFVTGALLLFGTATWLFEDQISRWIIGSSAHAPLLVWVFCQTGLIGVKGYFLTYFRNTGNAKAFARCELFDGIATAIVSLVLVAYLRVGVVGLVWGHIAATTLVLLILGYRFLRTLPVRGSWPILLDSLRLSLPLTPRIFFGVLGTQADKYLIGLLGSTGGVGIYSIGQRFGNLVFLFMTALQNVFGPRVYQLMFELDERGGRAIGAYLTPFAYLSVAPALVLSLFAEELVAVLTPASFRGAAPILMVFSIYFAILFFGKINGNQLIFRRKTHITSLLTLAGIVLSLAFSVPMILRWGVIGAAYAALVGGVASGIIALALAQHYYRIEWEWGKLGWIFGLLAGSATLLFVLGGAAYWIHLVIKLGALGGYGYLGIRQGMFSRETWTAARDALVSPRAATAPGARGTSTQPLGPVPVRGTAAGPLPS